MCLCNFLATARVAEGEGSCGGDGVNLRTAQGEFYEIFGCGSRRAAPPTPSLHTSIGAQTPYATRSVRRQARASNNHQLAVSFPTDTVH